MPMWLTYEGAWMWAFAGFAMTGAAVVVVFAAAFLGQSSRRGQIAGLAAGGLALVAAAGSLGVRPGDARLFSERIVMDSALATAVKQGNSPTVLAELSAHRGEFENAILWIFRLSPALLAFGLTIVVVAADRLVRVVLARAGREVSSRGPFEFWRLPDVFALTFSVGGGLVLAGVWGQVTAASVLGGNLMAWTGALALVAGLAVVAFYLRRWGIPAPIRGLNYLVVVTFAPCAVAAAAVGLFDIWFDFRKLTARASPASGAAAGEDEEEKRK